jgi:MOSC domain-containing protein YiiM
MQAIAHIFSLQVSNGGVPKLPVRQAMLTSEGLKGDAQRHTDFHGGPQRALCLYSLEAILQLQAEGHPIYPGSTGENVTIAGLDWHNVVSGTRLGLGDDVVIEITAYTIPCKNIAASFADGDFVRISPKRDPQFSRVYARVIQGGLLRVGQQVVVQQPIATE